MKTLLLKTGLLIASYLATPHQAFAWKYINLPQQVRELTYQELASPLARLSNLVITYTVTPAGGSPYTKTVEISDVARHHVIPKEQMTRIWGRIFFPSAPNLAGQIQTSIGCRLALRSFTENLSLDYNTSGTRGYAMPLRVGQTIQAMAHVGEILEFIRNAQVYAASNSQDNAATRPAAAFADNDAILYFMETLQWLPGNLFIGPANSRRSDDPGSVFEVTARNAAGWDADSYRIARNLSRLLDAPAGTNILNFDSTQLQFEERNPRKPARQAEHFSEICGYTEALMKRRTPSSFDSRFWEEDPTNNTRYRLKR